MLYEFAGEIEKAIDWYEIAYREHDPDAPYMGVLTQSHALHSNPRFIKLLRDMQHHYWADRYSQLKADAPTILYVTRNRGSL